tara:strand:- start:13756 stop:14655 length:900 start_codon:yes stop_codon:yes gene_type:complete
MRDCILIILIVVIISCIVYNVFFSNESFTNPVQTVHIKGSAYDKFYAPVYTTLISDQIINRTKYEIEDMINKTDVKDYIKPSLLDIGCGGGDHLRWLSDENIVNIELTGIDKSSPMLKQTKKRIGKRDESVRLIKNDINEDDLFMKSSFTHIMCYYFTIYSVNSKKFRKNIYKWLKPKGWFIVHVVDLEKFDPILDAASPFLGINPQKYFKNRITESTVEFKKFTYSADFKLRKDKAYFKESFKFKNNPTVREQVHKLQNIDMNNFIDDMGKEKMVLKNTTTLENIGYHNQHILYFQKS